MFLPKPPAFLPTGSSYDVTGLRPGEKLYEKLITEGEGIVPTPHEKVMMLRSNGAPNRHGDLASYRQWLFAGVERLYAHARACNVCGIQDAMQELVPEYRPRDMDVCVLPIEGVG